MSIKEAQKTKREEIAEKTGKFLLNAYRATGMSRQEAAERIGISPGYLTGLLAGRVVTPRPEIVRNMATQWGFNVLEYYEVAGLINKNDITEYVGSREIEHFPADIKSVCNRLKNLPPDKRKRIIDSFQNTISAVEEGS